MDLLIIIAILGGAALFLIGVVVFAADILSLGWIGIAYAAVIAVIWYIKWKRERY